MLVCVDRDSQSLYVCSLETEQEMKQIPLQVGSAKRTLYVIHGPAVLEPGSVSKPQNDSRGVGRREKLRERREKTVWFVCLIIPSGLMSPEFAPVRS